MLISVLYVLFTNSNKHRRSVHSAALNMSKDALKPSDAVNCSMLLILLMIISAPGISITSSVQSFDCMKMILIPNLWAILISA